MKFNQCLDELFSLFIGPAGEEACESALAPAVQAEHADEFGFGQLSLVRAAEKKRFEETLCARQVLPFGSGVRGALDFFRIWAHLHLLKAVVTAAADGRLFFSQKMQ